MNPDLPLLSLAKIKISFLFDIMSIIVSCIVTFIFLYFPLLGTYQQEIVWVTGSDDIITGSDVI